MDPVFAMDETLSDHAEPCAGLTPKSGAELVRRMNPGQSGAAVAGAFGASRKTATSRRGSPPSH